MRRTVMTSEEKRSDMLTAPIPGLLFRMAVPTVMSMLITSLYNMADTFFVGQLHDTSATGAIGVALPLMAIIQAIGFMFGHGSGNFISRQLGAGASEDAEHMAATGFFSALIVAAALGGIGLLTLEPLVYLLGSTPTIAPHAMDYGRFILIGAPWMVGSLTLNNQLRFQGSAFYGMIGMVSGAVLNIALDPLFIFALGMGVSGAALATMLSQLVGFVVLLLGTRRGGNLRIHIRAFRPTRYYFGNILRGGLPSLLRQGLNSVATVCLNSAAGCIGADGAFLVGMAASNDAAIAAMSIVGRIMMFAVSATIGLGQGFQPICGFNYGAKRYDRVRKSFWFLIKVSFTLLLCVSAAAEVFAPQLVALFQANDPRVIEIGALALRLQAATLPMMCFVFTSNMMLQTIGAATRASVLAVARQGVFFIPAVLVLPRLMGLLGLQLSQPVADLCALALAVPLTLRALGEMKRLEAGAASDMTKP